MHSRSWLAVPLVLGLALGPARPDHESAAEHAKHPTHTITIGMEGVLPQTTNMSKGDAVVFTNLSAMDLKVVFTQPEDIGNKIRCGLIRPNKNISKDDAP